MDTRRALLERMALCHSGDRVAGVFLQYALDWVQAHGSPDALAEARAAVGRPAQVEANAHHPAARLLHLLDVAGRVAQEGRRPFASGLSEVGEVTGRSLFHLPSGSAAVRPADTRLHAALEQLPALTRATCSFGVRTLTRAGPSTACLCIRGDLLGPAWNEGLVRGATGEAGLQVDAQVHGPPGCDVDLWLHWPPVH
jgi:uncharacterized protein (TIGR02265 family)